MKKYILLSFFTGFVTLASAQSGWFQKANFEAGARSAATIFAINQKVYVCCGIDSGGYKRSLWSYDPTTNLWDHLTSLGGSTAAGLSRDVAMGFAIGGKGYVVGGQGSNPFFDDVWEYDAASDVWTQKQNFAAGGRRAGVAVAINGKGYVGFGQDANNALKKDWWEYDPINNVWSSKANYPGTARRFPAAFVINNKAYVGTGDDGTFKNDMYEYDPINNTWTTKATFAGTPRYGTVFFSINNRGYIGLGYDNTLTNAHDVWDFDPVANVWTSLGNFYAAARANAVGVSLPNGKAYVGLGYGNDFFDDWWEFAPPVGIHENEHKATLTMFPNPMIDQTTITLPISFSGDVVVYDLAGKEVRREACAGAQVVLERAGLPAGCYVVCVERGGVAEGAGRLLVK